MSIEAAAATSNTIRWCFRHDNFQYDYDGPPTCGLIQNSDGKLVPMGSCDIDDMIPLRAGDRVLYAYSGGDSYVAEGQLAIMEGNGSLVQVWPSTDPTGGT